MIRPSYKFKGNTHATLYIFVHDIWTTIFIIHHRPQRIDYQTHAQNNVINHLGETTLKIKHYRKSAVCFQTTV